MRLLISMLFVSGLVAVASAQSSLIHARVGIKSNQYIPNNQHSPYALFKFGSIDFDTCGCVDAANHRFVIPSELDGRWVEVHANVLWEGNPYGMRQLVIWKNGAFPSRGGVANQPPVTATTTDMDVYVPPVKVRAGDYFTLHPYQISGGILGVLLGTGTYFEIRVVD